jgi:hypothetical protein
VLPKDAFDEVPRRQMVLSLNMKELKELSKLLYDVDCVDSLASQAARRIPSSRQSLFTPRHSVSRLSLDSVGSSSASTSRSQGSQSQSQSSGTRRRNSLCPLHRDDPLYLCRDAAEQVRAYTHTYMHTYIHKCMYIHSTLILRHFTLSLKSWL